MRCFVTVAVLALAAAAPAGPARASDGPGRPRVVLLAESGQEAEVGALASALEAHLSDFGASIEQRRVEPLPAGLPLQVRVARAQGGGALSVVWLARAGEEFFIFVADGKSEKILVQTLPRSSEGWDSTCDAIATLVRSALRPWLVDGPPEPAPGPPPPQAAGPAPPGAGAAPGPGPGSPPAKRPPVRALVAAAYAPQAVDLPRGRFGHGVAIAFGALVGAHFECGLSAVPFFPVSLGVPDADLRFHRARFELSAAGLAALGPVTLGLGLGAVVDVSAVRGVPPAQAGDDLTLANAGVSPRGLVRVRLAAWLGAYAALGVDVFWKERAYAWDGEIIFLSRRAQPRGELGLALLLPP